jgi:hypothetical protein
MPQHQRKWMTRGHAVVSKSDVRVTNSAARDFHNHFFRAGFEVAEFRETQRSVGGLQSKSVSAVRGRHKSLLAFSKRETSPQARKEKGSTLQLVSSAAI